MGRNRITAPSMISSVSLLDEASHTVRLAPGCDEEGSRNGNSAAPAVAIVRAVGAEQGIQVVPDPNPDRNVFVRADQYSFVREGVPSLFMKFGFLKNTPEYQIEHDWRANRYHSPSDDLEQPGIFKEEAVKLDVYTAAIALKAANADTRPTWLPDSIFGHKP